MQNEKKCLEFRAGNKTRCNFGLHFHDTRTIFLSGLTFLKPSPVRRNSSCYPMRSARLVVACAPRVVICVGCLATRAFLSSRGAGPAVVRQCGVLFFLTDIGERDPPTVFSRLTRAAVTPVRSGYRVRPLFVFSVSFRSLCLNHCTVATRGYGGVFPVMSPHLLPLVFSLSPDLLYHCRREIS
jgi:hypothetical protein